ncbi:MAG: NAD-dependent epimerase/dehydratase family protein [Chloroflexi bacterium]|nr:NAD-dependent epimerase/dehydratase family protein [Chloroflexota bacterium]
MTGGSGFLGRRLLEMAPPECFPEIHCLTRSPRPTPAELGSSRVTFIGGDIFSSNVYGERLASAWAVVHLAATTGRASPAEHFRVNLRGTQHLLEQCAQYGVSRFLYVSTIAVKFRNTSDYAYAASKRAAEDAVRKSGLTHVILRPTLIAGRGGGAWEGLSALARLPVIPLPGPGRAMMQPIYVDDMAGSLLSVLQEERFWDGTYELGGPQEITVEALLRRIHRQYAGRDARVVHLLAHPFLPFLRGLERFAAPILPVSAGQLRSFYENGVAEPNALLARNRPGMRSLDEMIRLSIAGR